MSDKMTLGSLADTDEHKLLSDIKTSIEEMQQQMQNAYSKLGETKLIGESHDKTVKIIMTGTYVFEDIVFDEKALKGGVREFKWRIREAWKNLSEVIQQTTQSTTMELLQKMSVPDGIKNLSIEDTMKKLMAEKERMGDN